MKLEVHNSHQHLLTFNTRLIVRWALAPFLQSPQANTCRSKAFIPIKIYSIINPNQAGGGKYARSKLKHYFSGTECRMYLKPSCKFKFICCMYVLSMPKILSVHKIGLKFQGKFRQNILTYQREMSTSSWRAFETLIAI